eukprot:TRINITY_DN5465_c0_g1_i1.p1 TRINITY_DN5465_c0_g1~~TRINITY_DN5465_c0_g1_i1.p1  ORF type:complete len:375 (+),score=12.84 TRINITY_DN5465_c0_g1_i1:55-1125(+)
MAMVVVSVAAPHAEQQQNDFVYAASDAELEVQVQDAVEASADDYALRIQLDEVISVSSLPVAVDLQVSEIMGVSPNSSGITGAPSSVAAIPSALDIASSSSSSSVLAQRGSSWDSESDSEEFSHDGRAGKRVLRSVRRNRAAKPAAKPVMLCGICFDKDICEEDFEGLRCSHKYCQQCLVNYIHSKIQDRRHRIFCPHEYCQELLTPWDCRSFLPPELFDQWNIISLEALIPESEKFYCPFPDCSGLLIKEPLGNEEISSAECPFCNRLFCARCRVPWHSNLDCTDYQNLPDGDKTESDLKFIRLASDRKWKRCGRCQSMVELAHGCNHITCRCGYQFCYICGNDWRDNGHTCSTY